MDIVIIPAYEPDESLIQVVNKVRALSIGRIIVVNDGSSAPFRPLFRKVCDQAVVLNHEENQGKGAGIKTALRYIAENVPEAESVVVIDADGQHRPEDAMELLALSHQNKDALILGARKFTGTVPLRSRFGNTITRYVFRLCSGKWVSDTQTGLRAFSASLIPQFLSIEGERYEYETNQLLYCAKNEIPILEFPIPTIYHDKENSCSHFHALRDSARIYKNLLAFAGSSFLCFLVDYGLFLPLSALFRLFLPEGSALVAGNISARVCSAGFNYYLNSTFVFRHRENRKKSLLQYAVLSCCILALNTAVLYALTVFLRLPAAVAKIITELLLFAVSFLVQKLLIFRKKTDSSERR